MIEIDHDGDTALVRVDGDIDAALAPELRDALAWAVDHHRGVVVDLSAAPTIDPTGLGVLVRAHRRARGRAGTLCFAAPSRFLLTVMHTMHVDGVFPVFDDCPSACAWLRGDAERHDTGEASSMRRRVSAVSGASRSS